MPGVPGTGDERAVEQTLAKRTALVGADSGNGADFSFDIADGVEIFAFDDFDQTARR